MLPGASEGAYGMRLPVVSVVVPCFNVVETVSETIASVTAQTMADFEIIAVDNNSTDGTAELLSDLASREPRLRVITEPVQGLSAARNGGIRAALGANIALLDADDLLDPHHLESHLANLADEHVGISYARVRMIDMAGRPTGQVTRPQLSGLTARDLLRGNPCTALIVVRAQVFGVAGLFNEELRSVEDQEWLFRAAYHGVRLSGIDDVLASYRITPGGLSADLDTMVQSHDRLLRAAAQIAPELTAGNDRLARASMLRYCARRAMEHNQGVRVARRYLRKMMWAAPDILIREPLPTLKAMACIVRPNLASRLPGRLHRAQPTEA